jgi:hypothetical protein
MATHRHMPSNSRGSNSQLSISQTVQTPIMDRLSTRNHCRQKLCQTNEMNYSPFEEKGSTVWHSVDRPTTCAECPLVQNQTNPMVPTVDLRGVGHLDQRHGSSTRGRKASTTRRSLVAINTTPTTPFKVYKLPKQLNHSHSLQELALHSMSHSKP